MDRMTRTGRMEEEKGDKEEGRKIGMKKHRTIGKKWEEGREEEGRNIRRNKKRRIGRRGKEDF